MNMQQFVQSNTILNHNRIFKPHMIYLKTINMNFYRLIIKGNNF